MDQYVYTCEHVSFVIIYCFWLSFSLSTCQVFRIKPPLCITEEDAHFALDVIRNALQKLS